MDHSSVEKTERPTTTKSAAAALKKLAAALCVKISAQWIWEAIKDGLF